MRHGPGPWGSGRRSERPLFCTIAPRCTAWHTIGKVRLSGVHGSHAETSQRLLSRASARGFAAGPCWMARFYETLCLSTSRRSCPTTFTVLASVLLLSAALAGCAEPDDGNWLTAVINYVGEDGGPCGQWTGLLHYGKYETIGGDDLDNWQWQQFYVTREDVATKLVAAADDKAQPLVRVHLGTQPCRWETAQVQYEIDDARTTEMTLAHR